MFGSPGVPRSHYQALFRTLLELPPEELKKSQQAADLSFLHQGITFTVYGNEQGTERVFPNDLLPRIISGAEWHTIERGLTQRITALNLFLQDIYGYGRILADGVVPRELIYSCKHFRREMRGLPVPRGIYVSICGTDLVRLPDGGFAVLEDNLRVPSGVSYMLANRKVLKRVSLDYSRITVCVRLITTRSHCLRHCARLFLQCIREGTNQPSSCSHQEFSTRHTSSTHFWPNRWA